jgi:hypothetical protein
MVIVIVDLNGKNWHITAESLSGMSSRVSCIIFLNISSSSISSSFSGVECLVEYAAGTAGRCHGCANKQGDRSDWEDVSGIHDA